MNIKQAKKKITSNAVQIIIPENTPTINFRQKRRRRTTKVIVTMATHHINNFQFMYDGVPHLVNKDEVIIVTECSECEQCSKARELKKKRTAKSKRPAILFDFVCTCTTKNCEFGEHVK